METKANVVRPEFPSLYTPSKILDIEKAINLKVCEKTLDLAQRYLEKGETISSFNKNFMNDMVRADPEKFKATLLQEKGMTVGQDTQVLYNKAKKYFTQSDEDDFCAKLAAIEKVAKKVMDSVFNGKCSLASIEQSREYLKAEGWVSAPYQQTFMDRAQ